MRKKVLKIVLLLIFLSFLSFVYITIKGNEIIISSGVNNVSSIEIKNEEIVKVIDKWNKDDITYLKIKGVKKGDTDITFISGEESGIYKIYVNKFGTVFRDNYLGNCPNGKIFIVSAIILFLYIFILVFKEYINNKRKNLYRYRNIVYLAISIFLAMSIFHFSWIYYIYPDYGLALLASGFGDIFKSMSYAIFPLAFIISILVTISNIVLVIKEGRTWKNLLGFILGLYFCFFTLLPDAFYKFNMKTQLFDIYNLGSQGAYIYEFIELFVLFTLSYIEILLISTIIMSLKAAYHIPKYDKDYIIILGCQIKKDGTLTNLLKSRADKAIEFRNNQLDKTGKDLIFIASGGKGNDEVISEGEAIKNYLLSCNISKESILVDNKSKNTYENILFSKKLINNKNAKVAFSTTNYHVFRSGTIASKEIENIEGIGSKTKYYFWINAFIREFIATLVIEIKRHLTVISLIALVNLFTVIVHYLSNNI